jgi:tetratricopeptide (TPR) repeat protein
VIYGTFFAIPGRVVAGLSAARIGRSRMEKTTSAEEYFRVGCGHLEADRPSAALEQFRTAQRIDPTNACFRSYYGLCLGLAERRFDRALELCRSAAREEFFNPLLYHNLARVHLAFGFKAEAIRYLNRGLMLDPACEPLVQELCGLGVRRGPVLRFLRRGNRVNRWLGRLRDWARGRGTPLVRFGISGSASAR